jgi:hypothetical protein
VVAEVIDLNMLPVADGAKVFKGRLVMIAAALLGETVLTYVLAMPGFEFMAGLYELELELNSPNMQWV